nr:MAG TPA: hypothetical protein [Caudoviricetes sp.]
MEIRISIELDYFQFIIGLIDMESTPLLSYFSINT